MRARTPELRGGLVKERAQQLEQPGGGSQMLGVRGVNCFFLTD